MVARNETILGVIFLKDILKTGIRERFADLRQIGIKTIMITGDNHLTAATIAAEAGVDDYLAEAKPDDKLRMIKEYQDEGYMVAMTGDGTNDAPALAQADVAVAMNNGTQPAREAANIIDLDSDPTKLLDIVEIGKQILMTRGALTTFSIANDIAKYFAIIPAALIGIYPQLEGAEYHGSCNPAVCHSFGSHIQCIDHSNADSACTGRSKVQVYVGIETLHLQPDHLWPWRSYRSVYRNQGNRPDTGRFTAYLRRYCHDISQKSHITIHSVIHHYGACLSP